MKTTEVTEVKNKSEIEQFNGYVQDVIEQRDISYSNPLLNSISAFIDFETSNTVNGKTELLIKNDSGSGAVDFTTFENKLKVINFDACLNEELVINISNQKNTLYFFYILEGVCEHSFNYSEKKSSIDALRTVSFASSKNNHHQLIIKKGLSFKGNIITIDRDIYIKNFLLNFNTNEVKLSNLYLIFDTLKNQLLKCPFNLDISKELGIVNVKTKEESITSNLQLQSRYQLILSQHIDQLYKELFNRKDSYSISQAEIQKIRSITSHIIENPSSNHSQDKLCSQFFVSQSKLQSGFKAVHKTTVSNFTRNIRLEKSEELLSKSELNVSEIVYAVGFTSRSYFSKIFKLKYGSNPTAYRARIKKTY